MQSVRSVVHKESFPVATRASRDPQPQFLRKPAKDAELAHAMKSGIPHSNATGSRKSSPVMDVGDALQRLDHDEELFAEIAQIFLEDSPGMLQLIHEAVAQADGRSLQRAAHSLKGLSAALSAQPVAAASYRLEQMGATGNFTDAAKAAAEVDDRVEELNVAVHDYLQGRR
jgi:HPt (histidine-containing phosphotransfer) domain-containing protein